MSNRFDFGGVNSRASEEGAVARPTSETPFCIAILGDFSGRGNRGLIEPQAVERRPYLVDRDNFDEVLLKLSPELQLPTEREKPLVFRFAEFDDFHPDHLFENEAFQKLKTLRERVQDSSGFAEIADELGLRPSAPARESEGPRISAPSPVRLASGSLLDEMIEQTESRVALEPARKTGEIQEFARQLAAKYSVSAPDPRQQDVVAAVDGAIGDTMRAILHHPDFQALEALWRATFLLVRQIETGPQLKIYLIDISKRELAADLAASDDLRKSGIFRLLVEKAIDTPGADPWSVVVGNFKFGSGNEDMELLAKLAAVGQRAGAAFLGEADPSLLGCSSFEVAPHPRDWSQSVAQESWKRLRSRPESASVALALPRFLLRLPYGQETSPLESFEFEEFPGPPSHNGYLWGNSAFVVALLLGQSFSDAGWEMRPGSLSQIGNLPLHTYRVEGDAQLKPCAEVLLTQEDVEGILDDGLIPLVSFKGRDSVRVGRFQSIAEPHRPLAGRWRAESGTE
jgi:type VI secretion system protein ImpC